MSLRTAIGAISALNEFSTFFQWAKCAISSLHYVWSGSQEKDIQDQLFQLESVLQRLRDTLPAMYNLIDRAEWRSHQHCVAELLPKLKDAVYDADDLLDEFSWHELKVQLEGNATESAIIEFFHTVVQGSFNKLTDVQGRLDHLSSQLEKLGLREVRQQFDKAVRPETSSLPNEAKTFGRNKELKQAMRFLSAPTCSKRKRTSISVNASTSTIPSNQLSNETRILSIPVLPIVGIGGVGKTTLAQHICNQNQVKSHFERILWICVSDDFDVKRLTKEFIESCCHKKPTNDNLDSLQRALSNHVNNKRLLIVLDDMWDDALKENMQCWKRFCAPLLSAQEGSMMLVTTRCPKVAEGVGTMEPITLEGLKEGVFWNFFKLCAFGSESSNNDPELEGIGRNIIPKLKGSPLAAKTLGRMLKTDLHASHWISILESELWELRQEVTDILPALRLSYMYLPFYLKRCFSFCAVYPKDYKFKMNDLSEIWVAEGFVEPHGDNFIQKIGQQYFQDLVSRSFFQKVGGGYIMHDLLHDMAQKVSEHECFILRNKNDFDKVPQSVRHIYVHPSSDIDNSNLLSLCKHTKLRTIICKKQSGHKRSSVMDNWCGKLLRIRVMSCASTSELPDSIGNLKHLRYLNIYKGSALSIPPTSSSLYNLQILDVKTCKIESLPGDFSNLRHLQRFVSKGFLYYPMCLFCIDAAKQVQEVTLMKNLNQFRGDLEIINVDMLSKEHAAKTQLKNKKYLYKLTLEWSGGFSESQIMQHNALELLQVLQPPTSLRSLLLKNYPGVSLPSWFQAQIINLNDPPTERFRDLSFLEKLSVRGSSKIRSQSLASPSLKWLELGDCGSLLDNIDCCSLTNVTISYSSVRSIQPQMWSLPALQELKFYRCESLTYIGVSTVPPLCAGTGNIRAFPKLTSLEIEGCDKLSIVDGLLTQGYLPAIERIQVRYCNELVSLTGEGFGSFPSLKHLHFYSCPSLNWQRVLVLPPCLQSLELNCCGDFSASVPGCLENLTSLVSLRMGGCYGITSIPTNIWCNDLALLENLEFSYCPNLVSIGGAKAVAKIKKVIIYMCPNLEEAEQIMRRV
ncbi:disease resistance protein RGA2-like [Lolium rigidum]|uniref:disease resistance protein RGA2-like n=1 Tax=Lolium rigidum TaxID=89674 RepID=UPI001F5CF839|nr:disease resistance protein RGA2-like [Lolium rigidum]XP_047080814.1 disease resistance protein RGA2-like [Lolium rigidum]XP_047080815.1 disease resistance protein RGA2-like [Lolium rigidum]XP_047080816.1 disease resistance protein RGA2-like [Lolium rigidum]XP_047080817.1 disease resistance protein RGA2-like [Lolium rigidum]XP_047080818.1 disease resistance protein RGA2-like [Lolium rigidum]